MTLWAVLPRVLMTVGTLYVAGRLFGLWRQTPEIIRYLKDSDNFVIKAQASTLTRFRESHYLPLGVLFQFLSLLFIWSGLLVNHGLFDTTVTWISLTVAAGSMPLILTKNARVWAGEERARRQARRIMLDLLAGGQFVSMAGLIQAAEDNEAANTAVLSLIVDGLIELATVGGSGYHLTESGKSLQMLQGVTKTVGTGIFP